MSDAIDPAEIVAYALQRVEEGSPGEARLLLEKLLPPGTELSDPRLAIEAHRTLARAYRTDLDFDLAREQIAIAMTIAQHLADPQGISSLLEAQAIVERLDGRWGDASILFNRATEIDRKIGNLAGAGQLANGHGRVFLDSGLEGGEALFLQALALAQDNLNRGIALDNLAAELVRQQRYEEAAERSRQAVELFRKVNDPRHLYIGLIERSRSLLAAGRDDEAGTCFVEAHDLIHEIRRGEVDTEHYRGYGERVGAIEAGSGERLGGLEIGLHVVLGEASFEEGVAAFEAGQPRVARAALDRAETEFEALGAEHRLIAVAVQRAQLLCGLGKGEAALRLASETRSRARAIGDAQRESIALSVMMLLDHLIPDGDELDLLAQARALIPSAVRQTFGDPVVDEAIKRGASDGEIAHLVDGGVLDMAGGRIAHRGGARLLADQYFESALRAARQHPELPHRLAMRLAGLLLVRTELGDDEAAKYAAELKTLATQTANPQIDMIAAQVLGEIRFAQGAWDAETLRMLELACSRYESRRKASVQPEGLEGLGDFFLPPYAQAAEVSLSLHRSGRARRLLERGKAQTLREALVDHARSPNGRPSRRGSNNAHQTLHYLVGARGCYLIKTRLRTSARCLVDLNAAGQGPWEAYVEALDQFVAASDDRSNLGFDPMAALTAILDQPLHDVLTEPVVQATASGSAVVIPHKLLHHAPLHLRRVGNMAESLPVSYLPTEAISRPQMAGAYSLVAAAGDSLGDLPFSRAEASFSSDEELRAVGSQFDVEWIRRVVSRPDVGLIHLACHGRFDGRRPNQSGLVLAAGDVGRTGTITTGRLLSLRDIATLPLDGQIVILSACSTGRQVVRLEDETSGLGTALLAAGASSVIVAQWPVPDLATLLLMRGVHRSIRSQPSAPDLQVALAAGRRAVTATTARDLVELSEEFAESWSAPDRSSVEAALRARHAGETAVGNSAAALRLSRTISRLRERRVSPRKALAQLPKRPDHADERYEATPFVHPFYWGAFVVWGVPGEPVIGAEAGGRADRRASY